MELIEVSAPPRTLLSMLSVEFSGCWCQTGLKLLKQEPKKKSRGPRPAHVPPGVVALDIAEVIWKDLGISIQRRLRISGVL